MAQFKRQTAYACTVKQISDGEFIRQEGWDPSYVSVDQKMLVRVRLVGILVSPDALDDGTGIIPLRFFQSTPSLVVGRPVLVIGRPRNGPSGPFLVTEIAHQVSSEYAKKFFAQRQELFSFAPALPKMVLSDPASSDNSSSDSNSRSPLNTQFTDASEVSSSDDSSSKTDLPNPAEVVLDIIRKLDPGDGAPTDEVLSQVPFPNAEDKLNFLIAEGEVFELRAGKIKVLE